MTEPLDEPWFAPPSGEPPVHVPSQPIPLTPFAPATPYPQQRQEGFPQAQRQHSPLYAQQYPQPHPGSAYATGPISDQPTRSRRRARPRVSGRTVALSTVLALAAGGLGGYGVAHYVDSPTRAIVQIPVVTEKPVVERPRESVAGIASRVTPSVVSLEVIGEDGSATGSGFVMSQDGYILTNNHVVSADGGKAKITVLFADGTKNEATLIGRTINYDLAVVKVDRAGLVPLVLGDSDAVLVGDPVIAIGAPLGLDGTVTTGIISAMNRPVVAGGDSETAFINALQTDAAINPGNSGGPLVNSAGEVIGINSAIAQPPGTQLAGGSIGLGFSIPSNQARRTAQELIETGKATYPVIGVLLDQRYQGQGVMVSREAVQGTEPVTLGSAADLAGIRPGDVILAIDGRPVTHPNELIVAIRAKAPGDAVELRVRSDGSSTESELRMVLGEAVSQ